MAMPSVPPEIGTAMKVWQSKDHEFYYPDPNPTVPRAQNLVGRDWAVANANKLLGAMKESHDKSKAKNSYDYPIRTELANLTPNPQTIMTNHFELRTHNTTFHEYEILDLEAAGQSRRKIQALFRKAIAQWPFLRDNQDYFATDGQKTIVSWKNLNQDIENSEKTVRITNQINGASIWEVKITTGGTDITARISHVGAVNIDALLRQARCDLSQSGEDRSSVERCINILISKSFNNDVVKSSGKKFYVRSARSELGGSVSLEIIRGYYYAVQPAIGSLLLNFNVATSAFFKPILVSEFLEDQRTFVLPRCQDLLKRLRVYVEREHKEKRLNNKGARIKSVTAIGSENIGKLFFFKKQLGTDGKPYKLDNGEWAREKVPTTVAQHHLEGR
jgi:eukaryotic translation initiation factor 2C